MIYILSDAAKTCPALSRWLLCTCEVGDHVASGHPALLHRAKLHPAPLAPLVHGYLCGLHPVDRRLLLPHGVDGKDHAGTRPEIFSGGFSGYRPFPDIAGHHHQPHFGHPGLHHGHHLPGSGDQCSRLHGQSDCSSTR